MRFPFARRRAVGHRADKAASSYWSANWYAIRRDLPAAKFSTKLTARPQKTDYNTVKSAKRSSSCAPYPIIARALLHPHHFLPDTTQRNFSAKLCSVAACARDFAVVIADGDGASFLIAALQSADAGGKYPASSARFKTASDSACNTLGNLHNQRIRHCLLPPRSATFVQHKPLLIDITPSS